jgi:hypothetical protein
VTILGAYYPGIIEFWVSETAFPALWRLSEKKINVFISLLLTVLIIDFTIFDNLIQWEAESHRAL